MKKEPGGPDGVQSQEAGKSRLLRLGGAGVGSRLDLYLATELALSRAQVRRLLESGAVSLDGRALSLGDKGMSLPSAGILEVGAFRAVADQRAVLASPEESPPAILAKGPGWVALDKPAGMPVHPLDEGEAGTALSHVAALSPGIHGVGEGGLRSGIVHRLDVDTSGALLIATEEAPWQRLRTAFHEHRVEKVYLALVQGRPDWDLSGEEMDLWLSVSRHRPARVRVATDADRARGRARETHQHVVVLERLAETSLVEVRPLTGFLHQIRATLAHLGHPVVGDTRYGAIPRLLGAERQMLHAQKVCFEEIQAESPLPRDFEDVLKLARVQPANAESTLD